MTIEKDVPSPSEDAKKEKFDKVQQIEIASFVSQRFSQSMDYNNIFNQFM